MFSKSKLQVVSLITSAVMSVCMLRMTDGQFYNSPETNSASSTDTTTPSSTASNNTSLTLINLISAINLAVTAKTIGAASASLIKKPQPCSSPACHQITAASTTLTAAGLTGTISILLSNMLDTNNNNNRTATYISSSVLSGLSSGMYLTHLIINLADLSSSDPTSTRPTIRSQLFSLEEEEEMIELVSIASSLPELASIIVHAPAEGHENEEIIDSSQSSATRSPPPLPPINHQQQRGSSTYVEIIELDSEDEE